MRNKLLSKNNINYKIDMKVQLTILLNTYI